MHAQNNMPKIFAQYSCKYSVSNILSTYVIIVLQHFTVLLYFFPPKGRLVMPPWLLPHSCVGWSPPLTPSAPSRQVGNSVSVSATTHRTLQERNSTAGKKLCHTNIPYATMNIAGIIHSRISIRAVAFLHALPTHEYCVRLFRSTGTKKLMHCFLLRQSNTVIRSYQNETITAGRWTS
jgi:hypothetical protein